MRFNLVPISKQVEIFSKCLDRINYEELNDTQFEELVDTVSTYGNERCCWELDDWHPNTFLHLIKAIETDWLSLFIESVNSLLQEPIFIDNLGELAAIVDRVNDIHNLVFIESKKYVDGQKIRSKIDVYQNYFDQILNVIYFSPERLELVHLSREFKVENIEIYPTIEEVKLIELGACTVDTLELSDTEYYAFRNSKYAINYKASLEQERAEYLIEKEDPIDFEQIKIVDTQYIEESNDLEEGKIKNEKKEEVNRQSQVVEITQTAKRKKLRRDYSKRVICETYSLIYENLNFQKGNKSDLYDFINSFFEFRSSQNQISRHRTMIERINDKLHLSSPARKQFKKIGEAFRTESEKLESDNKKNLIYILITLKKLNFFEDASIDSILRMNSDLFKIDFSHLKKEYKQQTKQLEIISIPYLAI